MAQRFGLGFVLKETQMDDSQKPASHKWNADEAMRLKWNAVGKRFWSHGNAKGFRLRFWS